MTLCVEALMCSEQGGEGVKLEVQVALTETGCERLDRFPLELVPAALADGNPPVASARQQVESRAGS